MSTHKKKKKSRLIYFFVLALVAAIPITTLFSQQQQRIISLAQEAASQLPPIFYCLTLGSSDQNNCASSYFSSDLTLSMHGFPMNEKKGVYYGDTLSGSATYTNTSDQPLSIKTIGLAAFSKNGNKRINFTSQNVNTVVQPGKSITIPQSSHKFNGPEDPNGVWEVFSTITKADGTTNDDSKKFMINVNATCTALRARPLTDADKNNIKALCDKNPNNKICKSRQYCEIIEGKDNCTQPAPNREIQGNRCDEWVILFEGEQELLEELCKAYPGTDTCQTFCDRTIGSELCVEQTEAPIATLLQSPEQIAQNKLTQNSSVAGIKTNILAGTVKNKNTGEVCKDQSSTLANGCCRPACSSGGKKTTTPGKTTPGGQPAPGGEATAGSKCRSKLANNIGQCCKDGSGLVNGCCKPGCGKGNIFTRADCPAKNAAGVCCAAGATNVNGTCSGGGVGK